LLKSVFGVGKLITTVSTAKVALVPELIGAGVVDQIIDYKTQNPVKVLKPQSVDFLLDTAFTAMSFLPAMKPKSGLILTITGKSGDHIAQEWPATPWLLVKLANTMDAMYRWRAWRWGVRYDHVFVVPAEKDLDMLAEWYKEKKVKAIIGEKLKMYDLENVRRVGGIVYAGKGGIGNYVIEID
jgi:NADPH:quinone reductase-like Zn-dependent oxidoreductase